MPRVEFYPKTDSVIVFLDKKMSKEEALKEAYKALGKEVGRLK